MTRWFKRGATAAAAILLLAACGPVNEGGGLLDPVFWQSSPLNKNTEAELGIAAMAKGEYLRAEAHYRKALDKNPRDVHALLGAGILYQNTGQLTKAREMYEAVLALRPPESEQFITLSEIAPKPVSRVASINLSLLDSGETMKRLREGAAGVSQDGGQANGAAAGQGMPAPSPSVASMPEPSSTGATSMSAASGGGMEGMSTEDRAIEDIGKFTGLDQNVVSRFATLRALRDQGLITQEEYTTRRQANIGALLPLTSPPPAAGLDRPVPNTEQVTERLRAIGRALELRAMSVEQHASERAMILDALMPGAPVVVAKPAKPPQGLLEAADDVRRLEKLRSAGYISSDEYARERAAIEQAMMPAPGADTAMAPLAQPMGEVQGAEPQGLDSSTQTQRQSGPQPGIHLASYRSEQQAERGWAQLKRAHANLLDGLEHTVSQVDLGSKGTFFRLIAGPFDSTDAAQAACAQLKSRQQFCEATFMDMG